MKLVEINLPCHSTGNGTLENQLKNWMSDALLDPCWVLITLLAGWECSCTVLQHSSPCGTLCRNSKASFKAGARVMSTFKAGARLMSTTAVHLSVIAGSPFFVL